MSGSRYKGPIPQPGDEVDFVWDAEQVEKMELRQDGAAVESRDIDRTVFAEAWHDPYRDDVEVRDLGAIVYVVGYATVAGRGEIFLVWRYYKNNLRLILPRTARFTPPPPLEGGMLSKGRERKQRRRRETKEDKKPRSRGRQGGRREVRSEEDE